MIYLLKTINISKIKKPFIPFFSAIFIFLLVNLIKKILKLSIFEQDIFYKIFSFLKTLDLNQYIPYSMFIKFSFFSTVLYVLGLSFFIYIYASIVQFFLHIVIKTPARFYQNLNIFYYYAAMLYVLVLIPIFGGFFWFLSYFICLVYAISCANYISKVKALVILVLPLFSFISMIVLIATCFFISF